MSQAILENWNEHNKSLVIWHKEVEAYTVIVSGFFLLQIGKSHPCEKPKMFIDCGMHAREWISSAVCLYIITQVSLDLI